MVEITENVLREWGEEKTDKVLSALSAAQVVHVARDLRISFPRSHSKAAVKKQILWEIFGAVAMLDRIVNFRG